MPPPWQMWRVNDEQEPRYDHVSHSIRLGIPHSVLLCHLGRNSKVKRNKKEPRSTQIPHPRALTTHAPHRKGRLKHDDQVPGVADQGFAGIVRPLAKTYTGLSLTEKFKGDTWEYANRLQTAVLIRLPIVLPGQGPKEGKIRDFPPADQ